LKHLTMLALTSLLSFGAHAANWVEISSNADGGVKQYLDIDRIERNLGLVELWRVFDYQSPYQRQVDGKPYASQLVHTEIDCPSRAMRQVSFAWYAGPMGKGEALQEVNEPNTWEIDSFDEFTRPLWKIACGEFDR
jgi:hypothetical protein